MFYVSINNNYLRPDHPISAFRYNRQSIKPIMFYCHSFCSCPSETTALHYAYSIIMIFELLPGE